MSDLFDLLTDSLAAWRLAFMLVHETGPGNVFQELRRHLGAETINQYGNAVCDDHHPLTGMFCCIFCMSIWCAALIRLVRTGRIEPLKLLAVSAGALFIDKWIH